MPGRLPGVDTTDRVERALRDSFGDDAERARALLPACAELALTPPCERVLLAVIGLADGDTGRLEYFAAASRADWRDVLYWWEAPEEAARASRRARAIEEEGTRG